MQIERRNYVASPTDVEAITRSVLEAQRAGSTGRQTYLRALVATTQHELQKHESARSGKSARFTALDALEIVHARFYEHVTKVVLASIDFPQPGAKNRARELNRRTNFARTAKSTVRSWIVAGGDIKHIDPATVTKKKLAQQALAKRPRRPYPKALANKSNRYSEALVEATRSLAVVDKEAATEVLDAIIAKLSSARASLARRLAAA